MSGANARAAALNDFAAKIAAADCGEEGVLFAEALPLFLHAPDHIFLARQWIERRAFAEAAMFLHRLALPAHGFQLGEMPAGAVRHRGRASTWQRHEHRALPFAAATPGLALLRAAANAAVRSAETHARAKCETCRGLGWIVTADAGKHICGHQR
jgi:hypothetical protein